MNKYMLIMMGLVLEMALQVLSLETLSLETSSCVTSSLDASGATPRGEFYFHPIQKKKFKRVNVSSKIASFKSLGLKQQANKKRVFIDWRKLYWGTLRDLLHSEEKSYLEESKNIQEVFDAQAQETEEAREFTRELRQELKSFAKCYELKIVWQKKSLDLPDATSAFLDYWDKGMSQEKVDNIMPFSNLCALSAGEVSAQNVSLKRRT